jgi:hypothetical protein
MAILKVLSVNENRKVNLELERPLCVLTAQQILMIDAALAELGPFSEVRLVKNKGKLRYIIRLESKDILTEA